MAGRNPFDSFFSLKKIGTGSQFQEGDETPHSTSSRFGKGLRGAFYKSRWAGGAKRTLTKNLSSKDIDFIDKLIGPELRALPKNAEGLSMWQRRALKQKVYQAFKSGKEKLSRADCKDAYDIVDALRDHHMEDIHNRSDVQTTANTATTVEREASPATRTPMRRVESTSFVTIEERDSVASEKSDKATFPRLAEDVRLPRQSQKKKDFPEMDIG